MRIDKFLSHAGLGTRTEVKKIIRREEVTVNDKPITSDGFNIDENNDVIKVNGEIIEYKEFHYVLLNKKEGYISATEDDKYSTVIDLVEEYRVFDIFPVGRLDIDTTGLLLLTNNGKLAHVLLSPKHHVDKEYEVEVNYPLKEELINEFKNGVVIDNEYQCLPAILNIKDEYHCNVIIHEGKFHQVKKMFQTFGYTVMRLNRIRMDFLTLDTIPNPGDYRELTKDEITKLISYIK
ncbi:MAG: rRNA pseudouridine synthase [Bacilli bacterium]|nr:rRNA pseudouridine synthase [Bacilli bacterium]